MPGNAWPGNAWPGNAWPGIAWNLRYLVNGVGACRRMKIIRSGLGNQVSKHDDAGQDRQSRQNCALPGFSCQPERIQYFTFEFHNNPLDQTRFVRCPQKALRT